MKPLITRQNYEEFFLLYVDGELSAIGKESVEQFVAENPDLADELALFQQMQLPVEPLAFADKSSLYRFGGDEINAANYEEQFLLYVDNELDAVAAEKVEMFVLQHPDFQDHFTLLKQTKLPAETIVFADKASLYRKEEKKPVIYLYWRRLAIAAVLIGLAISVWILLPGNDVSKQTLAQQPVTKKALDQQPAVTGQEKQVIPSIAAATQGKTVNGTKTQQQAVYVNDVPTNPDNLVTQNTVAPPVIETKTETSAPVITTPVETTHVTERATETASVSSAEMTKHSGPSDESVNLVAQNVVYKELDTDDEKKSLYLGSLEINKDKLRGFFRKASNLFRSRAKQEEENNRSETAAPASSRRSLP